jgi:hypothetical protein
MDHRFHWIVLVELMSCQENETCGPKIHRLRQQHHFVLMEKSFLPGEPDLPNLSASVERVLVSPNRKGLGTGTGRILRKARSAAGGSVLIAG